MESPPAEMRLVNGARNPTRMVCSTPRTRVRHSVRFGSVSSDGVRAREMRGERNRRPRAEPSGTRAGKSLQLVVRRCR